MLGVEKLQVLLLKFGNFVAGNVCKQAVHAAEYDGDFFFHGHGVVLRLNEKAFVLAAFVDYACCHGIDVAAEFGE